MKPIYIILGFLFLALGVIGVVVPLLPTTPFLLLATFFFMRGSERIHRWFSNTSLYQKYLESFVQTRSLKLSTKITSLGLASAMLITGFIFTPIMWGKLLIVLVILFKYYYFIFRVGTVREAEAETLTSTEAVPTPKKRSKMVDSRLLGLVEHSRKYIILGVLVQWIGLLGSIAAVLSMAFVMQQAWEGQVTRKLILFMTVIVMAAIAVRFLSNYAASMLSYRASINAKKTLRSQIYGKLLKLGPSYTDHTSTSGVIQVAVEGVEQLETYFGRYMPQLFYSLLAPVTLFITLSFVSFKAAIILLICVPLIPVSIIVIMRMAKKLFRKYWGSYVNLGHSFLENVQGLTTLKIYGTDQDKHQEMNTAAEDFRKMTMKVLTMQLNSVAVMDLIAFGGAAAGVLVAVSEYSSGHIGLAGALIIVLLSAEFFIPLRLLGSYFHIAMNGMAASDKIFQMLSTEDFIQGQQSIEATDIQLERVNFAYDERDTLRNISMNIPQGSFVSIVGESGSGKSTVAGLIVGHHEGYQGSLKIGGTELTSITEESRMRHMTWIGFNSYIFKGTVEANLRMGNEHADEQQMLEALRQVKLYDFILSEGGLEAEIEEQGANLSGGQRQRLALARALLHDSHVYIFDEATSNIDVESEEGIMEVIHALAGQKTVILISHRLENVIQSDCIYVLQNGLVAESGTHQELLSQQGHYAEMYLSQHRMEQFVKGGAVYA
ncbi:ATP-binding/permease protein CydD [compost metagenome]